MVVFPHSKINLGLNVVEKRADGYHNIVSCFYPIGWSRCAGNITGSKIHLYKFRACYSRKSTENLCVKAYHLLQEISFTAGSYSLAQGSPYGSGVREEAPLMLPLLLKC